MKLDQAIELLLREAPPPDPPPEYRAAAESLRDHLRTRAEPKLSWLAGKRPALGTERVEAKADTVCDHTFHFSGQTLQLGPEIDWVTNHTADVEWRAELNQHKYWRTLGNAYCRTGNPKYAREFAAQLRSWLAQNPVPSKWDGNHGPWRPFEAGIRCVTWLEALHLFLLSEDLDATELASLLVSLAEHGNFLLEERTGGNHRVKEAFGLLALGVLLPELPRAAQWLAQGQTTLNEALRDQFLPDGAHYELSPMYHHIVSGQFLKIARLSRRAGVAWPGDFVPAVGRMFEYLRNLTKPDGTLPQFNDGDATDARPLLRRAATILTVEELFEV
ncbi:MAG: heparinase II/III family protein, partial [Dehalococcoidia bacterium]